MLSSIISTHMWSLSCGETVPSPAEREREKELRIEADVSALLYRGFSPPARLSSCHPLLPGFLLLPWQAFSKPCKKFPVKNDQQEEMKGEKEMTERGETSPRGGGRFI